MVDDSSKLRKALEQIFFVLLPGLVTELTCHIRSYSVRDSDQGGSQRVIVFVGVNCKGGFLVFQHIDSSKGSRLGLSCCLGLSDNVVTVDTVSQPYDTVDVAFEELDLLQLTNTTGFLYRGKLNGHAAIFFV